MVTKERYGFYSRTVYRILELCPADTSSILTVGNNYDPNDPLTFDAPLEEKFGFSGIQIF